MSKESPRGTIRSDRLLKALQDARADERRSGRPHVVLKPDKPVDSSKSAQRVIKYANPSSALRQHVAQALESTTPKSDAGLRLRAPTSSITAATTRTRRAPTVVTLPQTPAAPVPTTVQLGGPTALGTPADLGGIVRRARIDRGLTQGQLAALAGTGRRFISELEAGKTTLEFGRMLAVCYALGVRLLAIASTDGR